MCVCVCVCVQSWLVFGEKEQSSRGIVGHCAPGREAEDEKAGRIGKTLGERTSTSANDG